MNLLNCMNRCDQFQLMIYSMLLLMVVLMVKVHYIKKKKTFHNVSIVFSLALQATVVTIQELKQYISDANGNMDAFIVQCFLTHFDLDGSLNHVITKRW